jgi:uncharacterized delta-60 repeat protein
VLFLLAFVLLLAGSAPVRAQAVLDAAFDPNADFPVWALAVEPDGRILIGGDFSFLSPNGGPSIFRNFIARLNQDGTVDPTFNPSANGSVREIQLQPDGKILVAGGFTTIGTQGRRYIARLDPVTGFADSFNPSAESYVYSIGLQADGKVLAGGLYTSIGGKERNHFARLDPVTGLADSFDPNPSALVYKILVQPDGKILASGQFGTMGGQTRIGIARLDPITGLPDSFDPGMSGHVINMVVQPDGKIVVGGRFTAMGGVVRQNLARLDPTTGLADSFDPIANDRVYATALQPDGRILAGGYFNSTNSIGGQTRNHIAQLDAASGLADSWDPNADNLVMVITVQPDGKILAGGYFTDIGGQPRNRIARFLAPPAAPTPTPSATPTPTPVATPTPTPPPATPTPTAAPTSTPTGTPTPAPAAQPLNLSTRMRVQTGDNVGIGGFIITGSAPKHVILRAMTAMYVKFDMLIDPVLELHGPGAFATITNDNWRDDPAQAAAILAAGLAPSHNLESAIDATLDPGPYTAVIRGKNNTSGVGLIEVYDLSRDVPGKLANISTRAYVGTGSNIIVAGFILGGHSGDDRIVARGIGPSLTALGVPNALANPRMELRDNNGMLLVANNDWQDDPAQAAELTAAGLAPGSNLEAAIAATLPPGYYTTLVFADNNGTGVGLVEIYDRGAP